MPGSSIQQALQQARQTLVAHSESPHLDSEILLALACEKTRTYLRTWPERSLSSEQQLMFQRLIARRAKGEPIAYLTGCRAFWDMELRVTPDTLIPRPETERLVELALEQIPADATWRIADLGTGSGAIALSIARERPRCRVIATDVSAAALAVARDNAQRLNIPNVDFAEGPWCAALGQTPFQLIISNPPYVHPADPHLKRGDLRFEPPGALQSQPDGLTDLRSIAHEARAHLVSPGWLMLEHGHDQGAAVQALLSTQGYRHLCTENDLSGNQRVSMGTWG